MFSIGDIVYLKGYGEAIPLVVHEILGPGPILKVVWFDKNLVMQGATLPAICVTKES
jgi:hypothetical protein